MGSIRNGIHRLLPSQFTGPRILQDSIDIEFQKIPGGFGTDREPEADGSGRAGMIDGQAGFLIIDEIRRLGRIEPCVSIGRSD